MISASTWPSLGHWLGHGHLALGFHDSIAPDGSRVRAIREAQNLSREALVANSDNAFSTKTLTRAEAGKRVSKEMLIKIARALDQPDNTFLPLMASSAGLDENAITIHHWDDECADLSWITNDLRNYFQYESHGPVSCEIDTKPSIGAWKSFRFETKDLLGFEVVYIFYDRLKPLYEVVHHGLKNDDLVVLDVLSHSGEGNIVSAGLRAFLDLQNILRGEQIVFWSAATNIVDIGGEQFANARVISKTSPDALMDFLVSYLAKRQRLQAEQT